MINININMPLMQLSNVFLNIWNTAWPILVAILVFCVIIFIHELGHFLFAKLLGVKVNEFAIGFGPTLFKFQRGETKYAFRLLPLGGFCAMEGEDDESSDPRAFGKRPVWRRIIIIAAGAVFNIILGFIIMTIITIPQPMGKPVIAEFEKNATSAQTGLMIGDRITKIDGKAVYTTDDVGYLLLRDEDGTVNMEVKRDGKKEILPQVKFKMTTLEDGKNYISMDFFMTRVEKNFFSVIEQGVMRTVSVVRLIWMSLGDMVTGRYGLNELSGPVGVTKALAQAVSVDIIQLMHLMCFITVNLGVFNLLPLPALDGGRLVFLIIEGIRRKPVPPKYEGIVHTAGFVLLMLLMVIVAGSDILKLIRGG